MESGAYCSTAGVWTDASSRECREDINILTSDEATETLKNLNPVRFKYKNDPDKEEYLGFIAEDVPELVATADRKGMSSMDIVAVLTKVVQEQQKTINELHDEIQKIHTELESFK
ncbi:MAG: tail fiber domain-containing protein [Candidatus Cloacimonetes bacterium]|nr:tail fiber domain-containing protein [Candidatus Cloacimonadota bacterium]